MRKVFGRGSESIAVLRGIDLAISPGEFVAITGPSGSGKSTLLQIVGGLDQPSSGEVRFRQRLLGDLDDGELSRFRREELGFVFQGHHLIESLTALENVSLPLLLCAWSPEDARERARQLLAQLGLGQRGDHYPEQLSGGEQQRVAMARALSNAPPLIVADEPTGNLDQLASRELIGLLVDAAREGGQGVLMATHDPLAAACAQRVLRLEGGRLLEDQQPGAGPGEGARER